MLYKHVNYTLQLPHKNSIYNELYTQNLSIRKNRRLHYSLIYISN